MRIGRVLAALAVSASLILPGSTAFAANVPDFETKVGLGEGITVYTTQTMLQKGAKDECMAEIMKSRRDALEDPKVLWPDPVNGKPMKQYLSDNGISEQEYLDIRWSTNLEYMALVRAVESAVHAQPKHMRSNNSDFAVGLNRNNMSPFREGIAWNRSCAGGIKSFADEKTDWVNNTGKTTGHYEKLIDPRVKSFGTGGIDHGNLYNPDWEDMVTLPVWVTLAANTYQTDTTEQPINQNVTAVFAIKIAETDLQSKGVSLKYATIRVGQSLTPALNANVYKKRTFFRGTWESSNPNIASVEADGTIKGIASGTVQLTMTTNEGYKLPPVTLEVVANPITSIGNIPDVSTESGTAPTLPPKVTVTYEDGTTGEVPVNWEAVTPDKYSAPEGGSFEVTGTVAGWADPVKVTVTVKPATVTKVVFEGTEVTATDVTTESGTAPVLPAKATVTWSNGDSSVEEITWPQDEGFKVREGGNYVLTATVQGTDLTANVTVKPATVTSVAAPAAVDTKVGVAPQLPQTVKVTWSNGDVVDTNVVWDAVGESAYSKTGTFEVTGKVDGVTEPVTITVNVTKEAPKPPTKKPEENKPGAGEKSPAQSKSTVTKKVVNQLPVTGAQVSGLATVVLLLVGTGLVLRRKSTKMN